ncbi:ribosomal protein S18 [Hypoxylon sp. FL0890]|nr:ribosomal protein S18 [Hypoxylon sp. FL0890]
MPPRIPFLAALRHPSALIRPQVASISTTTPSQFIRKDVPTATSSLLGLDSSSPSSQSPRDSTQTAADIYDRLRGTTTKRRNLEEEMRQQDQSDDYSRQMTRRWKVGDVYAPHDLSPVEMAKWRRNQARKKDLVDMLGLRPLDMYRNFSVISEFMTPHGRIKRSVDTGLRPVNQRKMAKAIRRAIGLGIHPSVHRHPELLIREHQRFYEQNIATVKKGWY